MPIDADPQLQRAELLGLLKRLHRHKDAAYGDAWRKRGEVIAIFANMARKYDRLLVAFDEQRPAAAEPLADTVADLCVYAAKYLTWIADEHPEGIGAANLRLPDSARLSAARGPDAVDAVLDTVAARGASALSVQDAWARLRSTFETLEHGLLAQATPGQARAAPSYATKAQLADRLVDEAADLLAAVQRDDAGALDDLRDEVVDMDRTASTT